MTKRCNHHLKRVFRQAGITATYLVQADNDIKRFALRTLGKHSRHPGIACANTSAKIVKTVYKVLHDKVNYEPLHDTMRKIGHEIASNETGLDLRGDFKLKEARKRANRFRKFTRLTIDDLPNGETRDMLVKVLRIFDDAMLKGVKK